MRLDRMHKHELETEIKKQQNRLANAAKALDKIHGKRDYSDEIAKYFHLGLVGFRRDQKKQEQTLNSAINNGVKACEIYEIRDHANSIISVCQKNIDYISKNAPNGEIENYSKKDIDEIKKKAALAASPALDWLKSKGAYGVLYVHGEFEVEKVDANFVAVRRNGELLTHCKTIKEAKAEASIIINYLRKTQLLREG